MPEQALRPEPLRHGERPVPPDRSGVLPEALYRLGDWAWVRDGSGQVFRGRASNSFRYLSHCVTVLAVWKVPEDEAEAPEAWGVDKPHVRPEDAP